VNIVATIASGPVGGSLSGSASVLTVAGGSATFSGLGITGPAGTYTLSFSSAGLTSVTSGGIDLAPFELVELVTVHLDDIAPSAITTALDEVIDRKGARPTGRLNLSRFGATDGTTGAVMNTSGIVALAQRASEPVRAAPGHWATEPVHHKPDLRIP
jgi:hypothetical protein